MRWLWLDDFEEFHPGRSAVAVRNLSLAEDHFEQHFPGYPVMPAALFIEGLAQTGGLLAGHAVGFVKNVVLVKVAKAEFTTEVPAGAQVRYRVTLDNLGDDAAFVSGTVEWTAPQSTPHTPREGLVVGSATIQYALLTPERTQALFGRGNFVFGGGLSLLQELIAGAIARTATAGPGQGA